jgi:hypothetical protein
MAQEVRISFAWAAQDESQLSVAVGETVTVDANADTSSGWAYCRNAAGHEGTARLLAPLLFALGLLWNVQIAYISLYPRSF